MEKFILKYRVHAVQRMFERNITEADILFVLTNGQIIKEYPDDTPYPSKLITAKVKTRPLHIVYAENSGSNEIIIITVYEPDPSLWEEDFLRRKKL